MFYMFCILCVSMYVRMYVYAVCFIYISRSPESPSPDKSDLKTKKKSGQKPDKKKAEQQPVHDASVCTVASTHAYYGYTQVLRIGGIKLIIL